MSTAPATGTVCPRTGRTWPAAAGFDLRTCTTCGGIIDVRHEAWWDASRAGGGAAHVTCPPSQADPVEEVAAGA